MRATIFFAKNICQEAYSLAMTSDDDAATDPTPTLVALADPNRVRIVGLRHEAPRAVGEIAERLERRPPRAPRAVGESAERLEPPQPQATKHLQALQRAGLVTSHPLGTRRIYA